MPAKKGKPNGKARSTPHPLLYRATREQVSQYTMLHSMTAGTFEDVKFYLFSRRRGGSGLVYDPRPLYANSALICKASSHLDFLLSAGFSESAEADMNAPFPPNRESRTLDYDYAMDSDLEDDGDDEADSDWAPATPRFAGVVTVDDQPSGAVSPAGQFEKERPLSPIGEKEAHGPEAPLARRKDTASVAEGMPRKLLRIDASSLTPVTVNPRKGRVVFIEDIAFRTWQAFIFYAYFHYVAFAPLTSQKAPSPALVPFEPPPCSPKSMYRLADKYGIEDLKQLALDDLRSKMMSHNILGELFSSFTMTYPGVQNSEIACLRQHITKDEVLQELPKLLQALEDGTLPRGSVVILSRVLTGTATQGKRGW